MDDLFSDGFQFFVDLIDLLISSLFRTTTIGYEKCLDTCYASGSTVISFMDDIVELIVPFGILILSLKWAISLLNEIMTKDFNIEIIFRSFLRLVIGAMIVSNSLALIKGVMNFSDNLYVELFKELSFGDCITNANNPFTNLSNFVRDADQFPMGTTLYGAFIMLVITFLNLCFGWIICLSLLIHGISRTVAVAQYYAYAPVALAGILEGGMSSSAVKYLKKFLAILLEPVLIAIALNCYITGTEYGINLADTSGSAAVGAFFTIYFPVIALAAMVAFIRKARKFAEDIIP